jgi:hypothetical protein
MTRRLLATLLVGLGALLVPLLVPPTVALTVAPALLAAPAAQASPGPPVRADERAFSDVAGCIATADNVLVSLVVDESASLQQTDPGDLRVQGITTALDSLDQLAAGLGESTRLHVSLSTFARSFETLVGWRRMDGGTTGPLREAAAAELPARNTGDATDYRQALQGARRQLDGKQRQLGDPDACKVMLWFTDGALDVDEQTGTAASQLCQLGGIADAVRRDGIAVIALALFTPGAGVSESQREQLRAVAEGRGSGVTCGTVPVPARSTSGIYLPANDPAALQELFGRAGARVGGGTEVAAVTCPGPECPGGRYSLAIDPGVAGARLLVAQRSGGEPPVRVRSPSGRSVDLSGGSAEVDGASVQLVSRDGFATLDVSYPRYAEDRAVWQVQPGPSQLTLFWFWGAELDLESGPVQAGDPHELRLQLRDRAGDPLPPTLYDAFRVDAQVGDRTVPARVTPEGVVTGTFRLGVDGLPPALPLRVSVTARSRPGGVPLGPVALSDRLAVDLPPVYPSISPDVLDFGELEGVGTATAELRATGSRRGPTRVCVTGSRVTVPGRDPADLVTALRECSDLGPGGSATVPLALAPGTSADGVATGEVTLSLEPADGSAPLEVEVPVELEMQRVVDESTRWLLVALLVGLALLLPLLVLLLANWVTAKFAMTYASRIGATPVRITRRGLAPRDGGALVDPERFDNAGFSGRRTDRCMPLGHTGITAEARGALGLRDAHGVAVGPEGRLLVSSITPHRGAVEHEAPMTLGDVDGTFVLVERNGTPEEAEGTLVMVVPGSIDNEGIHDRAHETSNRVDWEKVLAEAAPRQTSPAVAGAARASHPSEEREPLPWEADQAGPAQPPSRKSGSGGKGRRSAEDSTSSTPAQDADDDLPPLPDFLKED